MKLNYGTNCGLVVESPTESLAGSLEFPAIANKTFAISVIPSEDIIIEEVGWYTSTATEEANYEVGLYDDFGGPWSLLLSNQTNSKGTSSGWKKVYNLNWSLTAGTTYWIAVQCDSTTTPTTINTESSIQNYSTKSSVTTLPNPFVSDGGGFGLICAIYGKIKIQKSTHNQKELKTKYPITSSLTARTTKQTGRTMNLIPEKSFVNSRDEVGIY